MINKGKLELSPAGSIAYVFWYKIKNHTREIESGDFVVMPDHVHGILNGNGGAEGTTHALSLRNRLFQPKNMMYCSSLLNILFIFV